MKQCARCGQQLNDNEQFCNRCGGTNFKQVNIQGQPSRPANMQQQRPMQVNQNMNGMQQQRQMQGQMQQGMIQGQNQQNRQQVNRPNQPNRPMQGQMQQGQMQGAQQQVGQNFSNIDAQQSNQFNDAPVMKLRKMSKKEKQSKEMELMYAMKAATERGEYFDEEMFKQQHGWYEDGTASSKNTGDMSVVDWIKTLLIMLVPIVNIVVAILGIKNAGNPDYKKNYYKAFLIYYLVAIVLSTLVAFLL